MSEYQQPRTEDMVQLSELPMVTEESQAATIAALRALVTLRIIDWFIPTDEYKALLEGKEERAQ